MNKNQESQAYLNYLKRNLTIILIPTVLIPVLYFLLNPQPLNQVKISRLYKFMPISASSSGDLEAETAVRVLRSDNLQQKLGLESDLFVYKFAPGVAQLEAGNADNDKVLKDLMKAGAYIEENYIVSQIGVDTQVTETENVKILALIVLGAFSGLITSLVINYFRNF